MTKLKLKKGVNLSGMSPQIVLATVAALAVWDTDGEPELVITSINDSKHSETSLHFSGNAVDYRTVDPVTGVSVSDPVGKAKRLNDDLGINFDVIYEPSPAHIHLEYQPRRG